MTLIRDLLSFIWSLFDTDIPLGGVFAISLSAIILFEIGSEIIVYIAERFAKKGGDD